MVINTKTKRQISDLISKIKYGNRGEILRDFSLPDLISFYRLLDILYVTFKKNPSLIIKRMNKVDLDVRRILMIHNSHYFVNNIEFLNCCILYYSWYYYTHMIDFNSMEQFQALQEDVRLQGNIIKFRQTFWLNQEIPNYLLR